MTSGSLVLGLLNGITLGLLAIGLVLVYRSNRFLNVAHGQMGIISAEVLAKLVIDHGWNWWAAFAVCIPVGVAVGVVIDRLAIRPLRERQASPAALLLVTVGITQILLGLSLLRIFQADPQKLVARGYPQPFQASVTVGNVVLNGADVLTAVTVPVLVLALTGFLKFTLLGQSIRAAASNPSEARLCGISISRVSMVVWAMAGGLSAFAAILQAPGQSTFEAASLGPLLLFLALGAAALAAFTSIPLAMAGGVLIGLAQQLTFAETRSASEAEIVTFLVIIGIVLVRGNAIGRVFSVGVPAVADLRALRIPERAMAVTWVRHRTVLFAGIGVAAALLAPLVPIWSSESHRFQLSLIVVYALIALSLTVALGWGGQISLGQFAIVGAGAFLAGRMFGHHWSLVFVVIVVGVFGAALMAVIGLPALRVPGLTLAVTTLGFALVGPDWLFRQSWFGSGDTQGLNFSPPMLARGLGDPTGRLFTYYGGVLLVILTAVGLTRLRRTQAGRAMIAVRDNGIAAASFGITPAAVKVAAIALSGFIAGAAGVLWADDYLYVAPTQFQSNLSLAVLALPVIGGIGSIGGTIAAAVLFEAGTIFLAPHISSWFGSIGGGLGFQLMVGGFGLTVAILKSPGGIAEAARNFVQRRIDRIPEHIETYRSRPGTPTLVAEAVTVHFGGIKALDQAAIEVRPGEIVGLIGPNGAGKTTLLNVISGRLHPKTGRVSIGDVELTDLAPELRCAFGLSRSFQDARLFPGLTVLETVELAVAKNRRGSLLASAVGAPWVLTEERDTRATATSIIERLGLASWSSTLTSDLSTGTRRICDLAAQLAARPAVLLLDEPTAGVAQREAEAFVPLLRRIRDELDCSILIVEHDMPLLMSLCDRVYAMVSGSVIASGTPADIRNDPQVIASYLGTDEQAIGRSGRVGALATVNRDRPGARAKRSPVKASPPTSARPVRRKPRPAAE